MISIGFSTTDTWMGKLIRWFTKSQVSHVFVYFELGNSGWVVEAGWTGVDIISWDKFTRDNKVVKMVNLPDAVDPDLAYTLEMVGEPYDYPGLLGMVLVMAGRHFHRKWNNPTASGKAIFCSEMVTVLLQQSNYPGAEKLTPRNTSPDDLLKFLTESTQ